MSQPTPSPDRRNFLLAGGALAAGAAAGWLGRGWFDPSVAVVSPRVTGPFAMPGPYPGKVVEVHHPASVSDDNIVNAAAVRRMVDRGMNELTGADNPHDAWRTLFAKGDVVGIKVNPVGKKNPRNPVAVPSISSPELLVEVVRNLRQEVGLRPSEIIVFERYANEFVDAGYADAMRSRDLEGVRWLASSAEYSDRQVALDGVDSPRDGYSPELLRHVAGYDRDVFVQMGFSSPAHDPKDDRSLRSHLSLIVSKLVNKVITLPVLKDHRSSGVTLALKNMSHGFNNNVARSHVTGVAHGFVGSPGAGPASPNQCNTFIPTAVDQPLIKKKAVLHILDGLIGCYEGGPGNWNRTWATWRHKALFFATDPVALDHVGWDIIDAVRVKNGWPKVGEMGRMSFRPPAQAAAGASCMGGLDPLASLGLAAAGATLIGGASSEIFERRQPEHVFLAGTAGLGVWDQARITHRRFVEKG